MRITKSNKFEKDYIHLPQHIQKKVKRQLKHLASNLHHSSIKAKKIKGQKDIWEGRVNKFYRFTFKIKKNEVYLRRVGPHNHALKSP